MAIPLLPLAFLALGCRPARVPGPAVHVQHGESGYGLTTVLRLAQPFAVKDMNDDYQEARILSQDGDSATVEVVHHPLAVPRGPIQCNPNWKHDDASMTAFLRPTPTENWDEKMRADLLAELKQDGIDPDVLTDLQVVTQVSRWAKARSRFVKPFTSFFVHFPKGAPEVYPPLREAFDREKPNPDTSDQSMFENEILGKQMFYNRVHGACTSYSVYQSTIFRCLGIPTRIVVFVPPVDANDPSQRDQLLAGIRHNAVRAAIRHGLPKAGKSARGKFIDHMFNEVFVGNRWVRLNDTTFDPSPLDAHYLGLLTHVLTAPSLSDIPLARTWGMRYAGPGKQSEGFTSCNPYRLLSVTERLDPDRPNPEVPDELRAVHVAGLYWKSALPRDPGSPGIANEDTHSDFYVRIQEFIPDYPFQLSDFARRASSRFLLTAEGHPDIHAFLSGSTFHFPVKDTHCSLFGLEIEAEDRPLVTLGLDYEVRPLGNRETYSWIVDPGLRLNVSAVLPVHTSDQGPGLLFCDEAHWNVPALMDSSWKLPERGSHPSDFLLRIRTTEFIKPSQFHAWCERTNVRFLLTSPGQPDLQASRVRSISGIKGPTDGTWFLMGLLLDPGCQDKLAMGADYSIRAISQEEPSVWDPASAGVLKGKELNPATGAGRP